MEDVFLEISVDENIFNFIDDYLYKFEIEKRDNGSLIFRYEDNFCDFLTDLELQFNDSLAQYWLKKSSDLMRRNTIILKLITALNKANIKKQAFAKLKNA